MSKRVIAQIIVDENKPLLQTKAQTEMGKVQTTGLTI